MAKKKNGVLGTVIFLVILAAVVVGGFFYITGKKDPGKTEIAVNRTEKDILLDRTLTGKDYPATPREVLKLYCRLTKCIYNDELTDEEIRSLMRQIRKLYSAELLDANSEEEMYQYLLGEVKHYHDNKMSIHGYTVDAASRMRTINDSNGKHSVMNLYFTIREGNSFTKAYEEFALKEDEADGTWKIMGWRATDTTDISDGGIE